MPIRITAVTVTVIALTLGLVISPLATAQVDRVVDPNWTTPRTADGQRKVVVQITVRAPGLRITGTPPGEPRR